MVSVSISICYLKYSNLCNLVFMINIVSPAGVLYIHFCCRTTVRSVPRSSSWSSSSSSLTLTHPLLTSPEQPVDGPAVVRRRRRPRPRPRRRRRRRGRGGGCPRPAHVRGGLPRPGHRAAARVVRERARPRHVGEADPAHPTVARTELCARLHGRKAGVLRHTAPLVGGRVQGAPAATAAAVARCRGWWIGRRLVRRRHTIISPATSASIASSRFRKFSSPPA